MSPRYCIASGSYNNTAIWSSTDDGSGGASVPTVNDDIFLNKSVTINGWPGSTADRRNVFVGKNAVVVIEFIDTVFFTFSTLEKRLVVDGKLTVKTDAGGVGDIIVWGPAAVDVREGALIDTGPNGLSLRPTASSSAGILTNKGECRGRVIIYASADPNICHVIGRAASVETFAGEPMSDETVHFIRFFERFDVDALRISLRQTITAPSVHIDFDEMDVRLATLNFFLHHPHSGKNVTINQAGSLELCGNVVWAGATPVSVDWQLGERASLAFVGSNDQTINMPPTVTDQTWQLRKCDSRGQKRGTLNLEHFIGGLTGLPGEPGYAERLIVRGPSMVTAEDDLELEELHVFGQLLIPNGVTIRTEHVISELGSSISGAGTLMSGHFTERGGLITCNRKPLNKLNLFMLS